MTLIRGEDVRAVANEVLRIAATYRPVTNLDLQKIIYFLHGQYLVSTEAPLVGGYFEAWEYGPVHPMLYNSLRHLGNRPVGESLKRRVLHTGLWEEIPDISDKNVRHFVRETAVILLKLTSGRLVELSHASNTPWDLVTRFGSRRTWGARLDNELILSNFRFHKRSLSDSAIGDEVEEHPPSGD